MILQAIKGKSKLYKIMKESKIYKKSKKGMKMKLRTMNLNTIKIKKKDRSLMRMEVIIVKTDWEKEAKSRIKDCRNYRIMMENKICTMNPRIMIETHRTIISMIGSIQTMITEMLKIKGANLKGLLKIIYIWFKIMKILSQMKISHHCKSTLFLN